jgi:hypothetical protein
MNRLLLLGLLLLIVILFIFVGVVSIGEKINNQNISSKDENSSNILFIILSSIFIIPK